MPRLIRITVLMKRKPGMTPEAFRKYWSEEHAPKFLSVPGLDKYLVKYQRFHSEPAFLSQASRSNFHLPSVAIHHVYDGGAELCGRSMEDLEKIFSSKEYYELVYLDEDNFLDRENCRALIGWEDIGKE